MAERICSIDHCSSPHYGRGFCNKHYKRWRKFGSPDAVKRVVGDDSARLTACSTPGPVPAGRPDLGPCTLWTGVLTHDGYGQVRVDGRTTVAHRWAWELAGRQIPADMELDHLCHVRHCVRLTHLEVVTHAENMRRRHLKE